MASEVIGLVLFNALLVAGGSGILVSANWCDLPSLAKFVGLSYVAGFAYAGVSGSLALICGLSLNRAEFAGLVLVPWLVYALRTRVRPRARQLRHRHEGGSYTWLGMAALAIAAVTVIRSAWQPLTSWDAWAFWTPKSESIVYFGGLSGKFFHSGIANPDYPLLVPSVESLAFRFMGKFDTTLVHVQFSLLLLGFVAALIELTARRPAGRRGLVMAVLVAATPALILQTLDAYADVPLAIFASLAAIALWCAAFERVDGSAVLSIVFLSAVLSTKVEGVVFAAALLAVLLALNLRHRTVQLRLTAIAAVSVLVSAGPWRLWLATHDVSATHGFAFANLAERPERAWRALETIAVSSVNPRDWLLLPLASAVVAAYGLRSREMRTIAVFMVTSVALMILALVVIYGGTSYPFGWYLASSTSRVITTPVLLMATLGAWQLSGMARGAEALVASGQSRTIAAPRAPQATEQEEILWALERNASRYNEWLLSRALPYVGAHVLEVGAGIGTFTLPLAERGIQVTAIEPDEELADILEARTRHFRGVRVLRDEIGQLNPDILEGQVDSAICFNVLEHIADDASALAKMHELLSASGQLFLLSPAHPMLFGETDKAVHHERRYTTAGMRQLLSDVRFDIAEVRYVNPLGAVGWLVSSRMLRRRTLPGGPLKIYEQLVPGLRVVDRMRLPFGLSVWARGIRTSSA